MAERNAVGRPTKMTEIVIGKLEEAFAYGASDREACFYADINPDTLYAYQKEHPEFSERKEALKERPILAARQKVVQEIQNDVKNAQWYLERKRKDEFSQRTEIGGIEDSMDRLLEAYGVTQDGKLIEEGGNDRKIDEPVQSSSQDQA